LSARSLNKWERNKKMASLNWPFHELEKQAQPASQPIAKRKAAQISPIRMLLKRATRFPKRRCETVTTLCRFAAHIVLMPSDSSSVTSDGTPRIVDVIGATVTVDKYATALSRVSTTTGLCLSGGANR
jgi:hypothetical protein